MASRIQWLCDGVEMPPVNTLLLEKWLGEVASCHNRVLGAVTYVFCNDERILQINRQFLNHDYYTDIITFDDTTGRLIRGDIYLSLDTVASNARLVNATYNRELMRVIVHGVLHLCGINDKGPGEREIMEANEDAALGLLAAMAPGLLPDN